MKIKIDRLHINRFKLLENFTLDLKGKSGEIMGVNGTGKSTVAHAFFWLFTGKNADLSANFSIHPNDFDGNRLDHVDSEVEAIIDVDGKKFSFKKIYRQVWQTRRGSAIEEYTRNTTDHFVNDVPVSQGEFIIELNKIIDDTVFRILSDVKFFCGQTKPDFRRQILVNLCGDPEPNDIIANNPELAELDSILSERDFESHKKIIKARKKAIEKEIGNNRHEGRIPILIKEKQSEITDVSKYDEKELHRQHDDLTEHINDAVYRIGELSASVDHHEYRKQLIDLNSDLSQLEFDTRKLNNDHVSDRMSEKILQEKILSEMRIENDRDAAMLSSIERDMIENEAKRSDLKEQWSESNRSVIFVDTVCFACGQELPLEKISEQSEKMNSSKAEKLREINKLGTELFKSYHDLKTKKDETYQSIVDRSAKIESIQSIISDIDKQIHKINNENGKEYASKQLEIMSKIREIEDKIESLNDDIQPEKEALKTRIDMLEDEKSIIDAKLLEITHAKKAKKRIEELRDEHKHLAEEYQNIERQLWLIDEFDRKRSEYIENSVNQKFKTVRWKLFEYQQNGGVREICEPMINGSPYSSDLNTGARLIAGLDCINTFAKHYDITTPVFIDDYNLISKKNKQNVKIKWPEQTIKLTVSDDEELKII